jgi:MoaA/NifB/PqqE/SkfB family radical SAM enzyme
MLKDMGIQNIIISGGEPLLHPKLLDIMTALNREGFDLDLCSNGTLINHDVALKLKQYLSEISISIDGYNHFRHDYIRNVQGSFEKTWCTFRFISRFNSA